MCNYVLFHWDRPLSQPFYRPSKPIEFDLDSYPTTGMDDVLRHSRLNLELTADLPIPNTPHVVTT